MIRLPPEQRKVNVTLYLEPEQAEALKAMSIETRVPQSEYVRLGIDLVLERERELLEAE